MTIIIFNQKRAIHVFAREDTPVAARSNLKNFLEIASSLDDSLLATTFWNGKGRSKSPKAPFGGRRGFDIPFLKNEETNPFRCKRMNTIIVQRKKG